MFASLHLGSWIHPQVRRQLQELSPRRFAYRSRPGQTLILFVSLLPFAAGMTFPALETEHHGGGNGWGNACSILLGLLFALMGHLIYCYDMPGALVAYVYGF
ncbi:hypothetical protein IWW55_004025 [Coemansia sp. RSA 2706]|nr:hypothetical protein IWW55_004025 [Coemansia sp. RSA 2706]KAJ2318120.1 hypothetical protein IWW52_002745 [Coemansia sp. RSA 2704]